MPETSAQPRRATIRSVTSPRSAAQRAPASREAVIQVRGLVKQYGTLRAVDGIGFDVFRGEVFAFLGPNGAGKTTTCEILETLRAKTAGDVRVLGLDVKRESDAVRKRIGVLPQDFNAFDRLTCRENLAYFAAMFHARPDLDELLGLVSLQGKADARYETLSGGLKQRLGVAIALVNDPELVFLDEPTTGLDPRARREAWDVVRGLRARGKTLFLTTHYMEEAQALADRVAILNQGRIAALDTPDALIQRYAPGQTIVVKGGAQASLPVKAEPKGQDAIVHAPTSKELSSALVALARTGLGLEVRTPTLEDVFLHLTGQALEQEPAPKPEAPKRRRRAA
ncbi:MAG: ABC transporter ATP-binding protein [Halobacteriales archaeon]|nr:ABC transporter ATP-binding protein [Halobacteriales archaeon]